MLIIKIKNSIPNLATNYIVAINSLGVMQVPTVNVARLNGVKNGGSPQQSPVNGWVK